MNSRPKVVSLLRRGLVAFLVLVPALVLWNLIGKYRFEVPQFDELAFIEFQFKATDEAAFPWKDALGFHNEHRVVVTRLLYAGIYHLTHGNLALLTRFSFFLAAFIAGGLLILGRRTWGGAAAAGWLVPLALVLLVFSPAAVYSWQSGFMFGNFIPWACLVAGMLLLHSRAHPVAVVPLLALLAVGATFSFAMGLLLFLLFPLHAWLAGRLPAGKGRWIAALAWIAIAATSISLAMGAAAERLGESHLHERPVGLALILRDPLLAARFFLQLLGAPLGQGTAIPFGLLAGLLGLVVVTVWLSAAWWSFRRWKSTELAERRCLAVWLTLGAAAIASAALITLGRLTQTGVLAESAHYVVTCVYGLVSASALLFHFRETIGHRLVAALLACLVLLGTINGLYGVQQMKLWKSQDHQLRASMAFMDFFERGDFPHLNHFSSMWGLTKRLRDEGYIDAVRAAPGTRLADYRVLSPLKDYRARFTAIDREGLATGHAPLHTVEGALARAADAVLFAWQPLAAAPDDPATWTLFDIAFPTRVEGYYRSPRELKQRGDYFNAWKKPLSTDRIPAGTPARLRAYALDVLTWRLRAIPGDFEFHDGEFRSLPAPASSP